MIHNQHTLNVRGGLLVLEEPVVMGILNVTPDSFYDGGRFASTDHAADHASEMLADGARIIDIGGMSSRPGSGGVDAGTECSRVIPVLEAIMQRHPDAIVSIDTIHAQTAHAALETGASIVNDISGGMYDPEIITIAAAHQAPFVLMHMRGTPDSMQNNPHYTNVTEEVLRFFVERLRVLRAAGLKDILVDPGFGFGKTVVHNYRLLDTLAVFRILELPIVAGISRKSMICKVLGVLPEHALNGTTALHMIALLNGASVLRAHDIREARQVIQLFNTLMSARSQHNDD